MRYLLVLAALAALPACETPSRPPDLHPTLLTDHAWSRGEVIMSDPAFHATTTLPRVTVGTGMLVVRALDDTTIAATLPDTNGQILLSVAVGETAAPVGPVNVAGFRDARPIAHLLGRPLPWPTLHPTGVLAGTASGAVLVNLASAVVTRTFDASVHSPNCVVLGGPGSSIFPDRVVFYGAQDTTCRRPVSWQLDPMVEGDSLYGFPRTWVAAELGHLRSISTIDFYMLLANCDTSPCRVQQVQGRGLHGVEFSPRGDRAALIVAEIDQTVPTVLDPRVPAVAYSIPSLSYAWGAAFSAAGDTLFMVGDDSSTEYHDVLLALDATTGAVVRSLVLPRSILEDVALDPGGRWIYVAARVLGSDSLHYVPALFVVDRRTWTMSGVLTSQGVEVDTYDVYDRVIARPGDDVIYVTVGAGGYSPTPSSAILRYNRLPSP